jgi:hypothetical protein
MIDFLQLPRPTTMTIRLAFLLGSLVLASTANAGVITDNYIGGNSHNLGDSIGGAPFDISSATLTRSGSNLTVQIKTAFAGQAGIDTWANPKGIGYGDVLLSNAWTPFGSAPYLNDNASNGTLWKYGFSLDNRWSNTGGSFSLYELTGTNAQDLLTASSFMTCALNTQCYYRDGQAVAVNTASSTVRKTGLTGTWTVRNGEVDFAINLANSALANYQQIAMHWGETCQNDVIEGSTNVPEPASLALFAGAGLAFAALRRRRA